MLDHADYTGYTGPSRRHELDQTISGIHLPCLADLHHDVGTDEVSVKGVKPLLLFVEPRNETAGLASGAQGADYRPC